jgi:hypothetical protein
MRICHVILAAKVTMMACVVVVGMPEIMENLKHLSAAFVLKRVSVLDLQCRHQGNVVSRSEAELCININILCIKVA